MNIKKLYTTVTGEKMLEEEKDVEKINREPLEVCRLAIQALKNVRAAGETAYLPIIKRGERAISQAEGRGEK